MRQFLLFISCLLLSFPQFAFSQDEAPYTLIEDKAEIPILTPDLKQRQTRKLRLANDIDVYLISDPEARQSAAAMSVEVGAWSDPDGFEGMAHFCEHMLFMGTSKYPDEASYDRFMTANGGRRNAYTTDDHTNYMFSVNNESFEEGLDRFSYFFKKPAFSESAVDREMNAVDQEHAKSVETDSYRAYHVTKQMANPAHPFARFRTGTYETLQKISREQLMQWYRDHYSSNLMHLVVYSNRDLETLQEMVLEKFSEVENQNKSIFRLDAPLLSDRYTGHLVTITPVKDVRSLTITWEFPKEFAQMQDNDPGNVVSYVLGHEGEESLLAQLKREHLAEALAAGGYQNGKDNRAFYMKISLTREGVTNYETVIERVFQAIARLQETGIPEELFTESKQMAIRDYQFQSRQSPYEMVTGHARALVQEKLETYPEWTMIPQRYDADAIERFLALMTVDRAYLSILARPELTGVKADRVEPWTQTEYAIRPIPTKVVDGWRNVQKHENISLPRPNPLTPVNLEVVNELEELERVPVPSLIVDGDQGKVYFAADKYYGVPEVNWTFEIKTPAVDPRNPDTVVLADLYAKAVNDSLSAFSYYALMAGLGYGFEPSDSGFIITISGYSDKASRLFQEILKTLTIVEPSEEQFRTYKTSLQSSYENADKSGPLRTAGESMRSLLYRHYTSNEAKARRIRNIRLAQLLDFRDAAFDKAYVEGMIFGNLTETDAHGIWDQLQASLDAEPYPVEDHPKKETVSLPKFHGPYYIAERTKQQGNAAILMIQMGPGNLKNRAVLDVLANALEEPFYSELRTKQQTGYIVFNYGNDIERQLFSFFAVQSNSHDSRDLLARFELAIEGFLQEMDKDGFPRDRFETHRQAWLTRLEQTPKNQAEMTKLLQVLAFDYDGDFDRVQKRIDSFKELGYEEFIRIARETHGRQNKQRVAVLVKGEVPADETLNYEKMGTVNQLRKISDYLTKEEALSSKVEHEKDLQEANH